MEHYSNKSNASRNAGRRSSNSSDSDYTGDNLESHVTNSHPIPYAFEPLIEPAIRGLDLNLSNESNASSDSDPGNDDNVPIEIDRRTNIFWCNCGNCTIMPTILECKCCREISGIEHRIPNVDQPCITNNASFQTICLDIDVLEVALLLLKDLRAESLHRPIASRTYRLAAYRQFTLWAQGKLGKHVRRVIPSCVVDRIRQIYPEPNGTYHGFEYAQQE